MYTFFHTFAQTQKNVEKGVDKSWEAVYSSDCSAVEPRGEAGTERVPCKLNNEEQTSTRKRCERSHRKDSLKDRVKSITCLEDKSNFEAMTNSSIVILEAEAFKISYY